MITSFMLTDELFTRWSVFVLKDNLWQHALLRHRVPANTKWKPFKPKERCQDMNAWYSPANTDMFSVVVISEILDTGEHSRLNDFYIQGAHALKKNPFKTLLRIDNSRQSVFCSILPCFLANACTLTYNTWNKRSFFSPSDYILKSVIILVCQKIWI